MEQRHKEIVATELAKSIIATDLAKYLDLSKLLDMERSADILSKTESNFYRIFKLLNAVQECNTPRAFEDFIKFIRNLSHEGFMKVLEGLDTDHAQHDSKSSSSNGDNRDYKPAARNMLHKLINKFGRSQKPLGMDSGSTLTSQSFHSTSASSSDDAGPILSPLKEPHQATLISSSVDQTQRLQPPITVSDYRLPRKVPDARSPLTTPTSAGSNGRRLYNESPPVTHMNRSCQTPKRPTELTSFNNLSLAEESSSPNESSGQSGRASPVISWHPYAQSPNYEGGSRASSPHRCLPSFSSASSESGESSSDSLIVDPNLILDSNVMTAIAREGPNMMSVKTATVCHNNPEEDYKMTSRPRGKCLIVNNINFEDDIFPTRKGSDEDANRFDHIFRQLGFETIMTRNLTADQMRARFQELSTVCKPEHNALFVFILSHGSEHGIYGTDGLEVHLESEIISCFDNRNCPAMIGKPKVFVIQACRGRSKDCGGDGDTTDSIAWAPALSSPTVRPPSQENRVPPSWLPSNQPSDSKRRKHPIRTDMLLVFSCLAGFVSVRNETAGSWLGVALAYFIMTHAHERDLLRILNLVTSDIIQRESSHGHIQSIELKLLGWTKNLYFNPGIYL